MSFVVIRCPGGISFPSLPKITDMQVRPQIDRSALKMTCSLKLTNSNINCIYDITDATD